MRTGLVLEGGAMRGMFTAGVLDVFLERGITFDGACGVSAGAVFGCNLKSGQAGRTIRYNTRFCGDARYGSFRSLLKTGDLYDAEFCYREIPEKLDIFDTEAFRKNPMAFYVVCTDVDTGMPVYKRIYEGIGEELLWMRASASLPFVSRIVEVGGRRLLDGGISDSVPLRFMEGIGYTKNVVVLTRPRTYVKKRAKSVLMRLLLRKEPYLLDAIEARADMYNETLEYICEKEKRGEVFVIRPEAELAVGKMEKDPEKLRTAYAEGRRAAHGQMEALLHYLKNE